LISHKHPRAFSTQNKDKLSKDNEKGTGKGGEDQKKVALADNWSKNPYYTFYNREK